MKTRRDRPEITQLCGTRLDLRDIWTSLFHATLKTT